jgi:hypothetical protein
MKIILKSQWGQTASGQRFECGTSKYKAQKPPTWSYCSVRHCRTRELVHGLHGQEETTATTSGNSHINSATISKSVSYSGLQNTATTAGTMDIRGDSTGLL